MGNRQRGRATSRRELNTHDLQCPLRASVNDDLDGDADYAVRFFNYAGELWKSAASADM
jgi:hypothetical protein